MQPTRTISEIPAHIKILPIIQIPLYQKLSAKVEQLRCLGISYEKISRELNISESTVLRAIKYTE
jgi:DNA-binding Lrp family transcriptional regulator